MTRTKKPIDMLDGPLLSNVIRYTVPIILTSILQLLFNAADLVVVGRFCGSNSVGAVGATGSLTGLIVQLFNGISIGAGVVVAQALGGGDRVRIQRTIHTAIPVAAIGGVAVTVIGCFFAPLMLGWMGTPAEFIDLSTVYVRIYFIGMIPGMIYNFGAAILRAAGDTKSPLYFLALAGVVNVGLNVLFVTQWDMDVAGVALATAVSQLISCILVLWVLMRRQDACKLQLRKLSWHLQPLRQMLVIGIPTGLQSCMFSISNLLIQASVNAFGAVAVAGNAAAANIEGFFYMAMYAFSQTSMNFVGQNVGAGRPRRIMPIYRTCVACMAVTGALVCLAGIVFARPLLSIYIPDSAEAIDYGVLRMSIVTTTYVICGIMDVTGGTIRGTGSSLPPMVVSIVGVCLFRVAWILAVSPLWNTLGSVFIAYPISWTLTLIVLYVILRKRVQKLRKLNEGAAL